MTIGLLLIALVVLWQLCKPRWPPRVPPQMSDAWRRDQLYTAGKQEQRSR